jgi:hypothetical protein
MKKGLVERKGIEKPVHAIELARVLQFKFQFVPDAVTKSFGFPWLPADECPASPTTRLSSSPVHRVFRFAATPRNL